MATGLRVVDQLKIVHALKEVVPAGATPAYVSMKGYANVGILVTFKNGTTVTGSAITVNQAQNVSGLNAKPVPFSTYFAIPDDAASSLWSQLAASGNTFTTDNTNSKNGMYMIEIPASALDQQNGFDCIQAGVGNATAATIGVFYLMGPHGRFSGGFDSMMEPLNN